MIIAIRPGFGHVETDPQGGFWMVELGYTRFHACSSWAATYAQAKRWLREL